MITELVQYHVFQDKIASLPGLNTGIETFLKTQPGFISRRVLRDHHDPALLVDIVEWESLAEAEAAAALAQSQPEMVPFFEAIEKITSFLHLKEAV